MITRQKYRTDARTKYDIMKYCAENTETYLSKISRATNLSHYQLSHHLSTLTQNGLLRIEERHHDRARGKYTVDKNKNFYITTELGRKAMDIIIEMEELLYGVVNE
jgi:predicted transcriptional regulator